MAKSTDDDSTPAAEQAAKDTDVSATDAKAAASTGTTAQAATTKATTTKATTKKAGTGTRAERLRSGNPLRRASATEAGASGTRGKAGSATPQRVKAQKVGNPGWFVPVMLGLMVIGLLWVVTFYISGEQYPVEAWGFWNLGAGFAFILVGFAMTTRWR